MVDYALMEIYILKSSFPCSISFRSINKPHLGIGRDNSLSFNMKKKPDMKYHLLESDLVPWHTKLNGEDYTQRRQT